MAAQGLGKRQRCKSLRGTAPITERQLLADAKALAAGLSVDLETIDCPPAVLVTALAIVVGHVAGQIDASAREGFYDYFLMAARESEVKWAHMDGRPRPIH